MAEKSDLVDIEVTIVSQTEKAYKVASDNTGVTEWVPKSQCEYEPGNNWENIGTLTLSRWLAEDKRLV